MYLCIWKKKTEHDNTNCTTFPLQSMSATSGGSSSYVRLSDNEISKILSIPVSLVSESSQEAVSCAETQAKSNLVSSAASGSVCDNVSRNLLHLNKV